MVTLIRKLTPKSAQKWLANWWKIDFGWTIPFNALFFFFYHFVMILSLDIKRRYWFIPACEVWKRKTRIARKKHSTCFEVFCSTNLGAWRRKNIIELLDKNTHCTVVLGLMHPPRVPYIVFGAGTWTSIIKRPLNWSLPPPSRVWRHLQRRVLKALQLWKAVLKHESANSDQLWRWSSRSPRSLSTPVSASTHLTAHQSGGACSPVVSASETPAESTSTEVSAERGKFRESQRLSTT